VYAPFQTDTTNRRGKTWALGRKKKQQKRGGEEKKDRCKLWRLKNETLHDFMPSGRQKRGGKPTRFQEKKRPREKGSKGNVKRERSPNPLTRPEQKRSIRGRKRKEGGAQTRGKSSESSRSRRRNRRGCINPTFRGARAHRVLPGAKKKANA